MNISGIASDRTVVGQVLRAPLRLIPKSMPLPVLQGKLKGKLWVTGSSSHGCWLGSYEYDKRIFFEKTVQKGSILFDIGAHAGFYSMLGSVLVGQEGHVYAFEPCQSNINAIKKHLSLNKLKNVTLIEAGISDNSGSSFFVAAPSSSMGGVFDTDAEGTGVSVDVVALDELISKGELPPPDYIKMDIEGGELKALMGAKEMLKKHKPTIFLATHGKEIHEECCHFLRSLNYKLKSLDKGLALEDTDELIAFS